MNKRKENNWDFDHIGHAVNNIELSISFYRDTLGFTLDLRESLENHLVDVAFLSNSTSCIELLAPQPNNTILKKFLSQRGEGLHHICYKVESVKEELEKLKANGISLVDHTPRLGSRNMYVAFIHPKSTHGILLEICSTKE